MNLLCVLAVLAAAPDEVAKPEPQPVAPSTGSRLRLGVGFRSAGGTANGFDMLGFSAHLGVQANDHVAVYGLLQGGASLGSASFGIAAMAEVAPLDWFAFGLGLGTTTVTMQGQPASLTPLGATAFGLPARLTFMFGRSVDPGQYRNRFYVAVDSFMGVRPFAPTSIESFVWSAGLSLGYQLM